MPDDEATARVVMVGLAGVFVVLGLFGTLWRMELDVDLIQRRVLIGGIVTRPTSALHSSSPVVESNARRRPSADGEAAVAGAREAWRRAVA
jgi:hypothetical protein